MSGLVALLAGGSAALAVALIAAVSTLGRHRVRQADRSDPELARAAAEIQSQIDRGRGLPY